MGRYELWTNNVDYFVGEELERGKDSIWNYDYLIVWKQDKRIQSYMKELGFQQYISNDAVVIKLNAS